MTEQEQNNVELKQKVADQQQEIAELKKSTRGWRRTRYQKTYRRLVTVTNWLHDVYDKTVHYVRAYCTTSGSLAWKQGGMLEKLMNSQKLNVENTCNILLNEAV